MYIYVFYKTISFVLSTKRCGCGGGSVGVNPCVFTPKFATVLFLHFCVKSLAV